MRATLTIGRAPEVAVDARRYVVECPHGTTEGIVLPGARDVAAATIVRELLVRHDHVERCRCTRRLWRRWRPATGVRARS